MRGDSSNQRAWAASNPLGFDLPPGAYVPPVSEQRQQAPLTRTEREKRRKARKAARKARRQK